MRYRIDTFTPKGCKKEYRKSKSGALDHGRKQFIKKGVQKVEIWDLGDLAVGSANETSYGPTLVKVHKIGA